MALLHRIYLDRKLFGAGDLDKKQRMEKIMTLMMGRQMYPEEGGKEMALAWYVIHPNSLFKEVWNIILVMLLIQTATIMPYQISF